MKFLHLTFHFEFRNQIEDILDAHDLEDYVFYSMQEGRDEQGKHFGTQAFPGNTSVVQAQVPEDRLEGLMEDLQEFKQAKKAHQHLEALILPIDRRLE